MAGRVENLRNILTPEGLVKELVQRYSSWSIQRRQKEQEWTELRNYLFATDTTKTTNSKLPWKNKTTLPKLTQLRDNLHANYMDALFPNDDWFRWEAYESNSADEEKRVAIEAYMKNKIRESGFKQEIGKLLYDYIDYGNAFGDVEYVRETHIDPVSGEEEATYIGPRAVRISPYDHVFNPLASDYAHSPKFTRYLKGFGELKKDIKEKPGLGYDPTVVQKMLDLRSNISGYKLEDFNKLQGLTIDGFGSMYEYLGSGYIELLEYEGDIYDTETQELLENQIITIVDRKFILRKIRNPSWFGRDTKEHVGWRERSDNLYAMGPLDNLVGLQYRLDHLENLKADAFDLNVAPPIKIIGDVEPFTWQPFEQIHIAEDGDVVPIPPSAQILAVNNEIGSILQLMEEMAGAPKEAMGIRTPGEKTAFEVGQLQNAAGRMFQNKTLKFEHFIEKLLNKMFEVSRRNLDLKETIKVIDPDIGVEVFIDITKDDLVGKGKLRPIGAKHYAARAQLVQNILGIFNSPVGNLIAPHLSSKKLAQLVEDYMGFTRFDFIQDNVAIFEQAETQKLIGQVQQENQVASEIPVEEELQGLV